MATSFFPCHQTSGECPPSLPTSFFPPSPFGSVTSFSALTIPEWWCFPPSRPGLSPLASIFTFPLVISFHCSVLPGGLGVYLKCIDLGLSQRLKSYPKRGTEVSSLPAGPSRGHASSANLRSPGRFPTHDSIASFSVTRQGCMKQGSAW